jgi:hypothetical protein
VLVDGRSSADCGLIREGARSFQAALNGHETKFEREIIGVDCAESEQTSLFEKEQPVSTQFRERWWTRLAI